MYIHIYLFNASVLHVCVERENHTLVEKIFQIFHVKWCCSIIRWRKSNLVLTTRTTNLDINVITIVHNKDRYILFRCNWMNEITKLITSLQIAMIIPYLVWIEITKREYRQRAVGLCGWSLGLPTGSGQPFRGHSTLKEPTRWPVGDQEIQAFDLVRWKV